MRSPGSRVICCEMKLTRAGTLNTRSDVDPSCIGIGRAGVRAAAGDPPRAERQAGSGVDLVRRDEHGADRQERVAALRAQPLAVALLALAEGGGVALPVAGADVVDDDVARDVVHRRRLRHAARRPADDDAQLHLEVQGVGAGRADDRLAVADDRVGELREQHRPVRRRAAALLDVVGVVEPDADDLAGRVPNRPMHGDRACASSGLTSLSAPLGQRPPRRPVERVAPVVDDPDADAQPVVRVDVARTRPRFSSWPPVSSRSSTRTPNVGSPARSS